MKVKGTNDIDWQRIENAPRDGTPCLLFSRNSDQIYIGSMNNGEWFAADWNYDCCGCKEAKIKPTHWMPLPDNPDLIG